MKSHMRQACPYATGASVWAMCTVFSYSQIASAKLHAHVRWVEVFGSSSVISIDDQPRNGLCLIVMTTCCSGHHKVDKLDMAEASSNGASDASQEHCCARVDSCLAEKRCWWFGLTLEADDWHAILQAAVELCWLTCVSSALNGEELTRCGGTATLGQLLTRTVSVLPDDVLPTQVPVLSKSQAAPCMMLCHLLGTLQCHT